MNNKRFIVKALEFIAIFSVLYGCYSKVITPKYYTDQIYSTTTTYKGFYNLKRDTVDVLFLGSSHGSCGFLPQELYDDYGITSYNLSCEQQSVLTSYYWLKEACKYQKPKVVVFECYMLFGDNSYGPLVSEPDITRKAFESMRWSKNKIDAINDICEIDTNENKVSYFFPHILYHERWKDLERKDVDFKQASYSELKGYTMISHKTEGDYNGYQKIDTSDTEDMNPLMNEYFEKIREFCDSQNITLLMAYTPNIKYGKQVCATLKSYSEETGIRLIDFNDYETFVESGYNYANMNSDKGHANIWGAGCITKYIGKVLQTEYGLEKHMETAWDDTAEFYRFALDQCALIYMDKPEQIEEYFDIISDSRYDVKCHEEGSNIKRYEISEKRTNRLIDIVHVKDESDGKLIEHEYVDIN